MVDHAMRDTYRVVATRDDDGHWMAVVENLPAAHTDARNLETLDRYVRDVIVLADDLPDDEGRDLHLDWEFRAGDDHLDTELAELRHRRAALEDDRLDIDARTRKALAGIGIHSVRDSSAMLGVSRARVHQLSDHRG